MTGDGAKPPISAHPAFPAIVALWFAALLGFGSLVLPAPLFEAFFAATGISGFVPSAAPPLGFTARSLIALASGVLGAIIGLVIARRIALTHAPQRESRFDPIAVTGGRRKPLLAHDDLDEAGIATQEGDASADTVTENPMKRRTLAIAEDSSRSYFLDAAPLPGQDLHVSPAEAEALGQQVNADDSIPVPPSQQVFGKAQQRQEFAVAAEPEEHSAPAHDTRSGAAPLELGEFAETTDEQVATLPAGQENVGDHTPADLTLAPKQRQEFARQDPSMTDTQQFQPFENSQPASEESDDFDTVADAKFGKATADPLAFTPPSLQRRSQPEEPEFNAAPELITTADSTAPQLTAVPNADEDHKPASLLGDAALDGLGLVQLAERLGMSIEKRRAWLAENRTAAHIVLPGGGLSPQGFEEAAAPEDAARAMAAYFGAPDDEESDVSAEEHAESSSTTPALPQEFVGEENPLTEPPMGTDGFERPGPVTDSVFAEAPSALRGLEMLDEDEDVEEDIAASLSLPLGGRAFDRPRSIADFNEIALESEDSDGEQEEGEDDYSSLLAMKNPFERKPEFVRIEEPELEEDDIEPAVRFPNAVPPAQNVGAEARPFDRPAGAITATAPTASATPLPPRAADPNETERDLRSALSALQRMSGAA